MDKEKLREMIRDSAVLCDTASYRVWLESVLVSNDRLKKARYVITLISYWLNAEDNTYCPVEPYDIKDVVSILLSYISTEYGADMVDKYRYDYKALGNLDAKRYVGGVTIANTIHFLDVICEEYDGRRCKRCRSKMTKSAIYCTHCGERFDFKYNF